MITPVPVSRLVDPNDVWYMMLRKEFACASVLRNVALSRAKFKQQSPDERNARLKVAIERSQLILCDSKDIEIFDQTWQPYLDRGKNSFAQIKIARYARQFFLSAPRPQKDYDSTVFYILHESRNNFVPITICVMHYKEDTAKLDAIWRSVWGGLNGRENVLRGKGFKLVTAALRGRPEVRRVFVDAETEGSKKMYQARRIQLYPIKGSDARGRFWFKARDALEGGKGTKKRRKIACRVCFDRNLEQLRCSLCQQPVCGDKCFEDHCYQAHDITILRDKRRVFN